MPDVNVWIALAAELHIHHRLVRGWFGRFGNDDSVSFCRVTQLGFLRLLTNPRVMQDEVLSPADAWLAYSSLRMNASVEYLAEPAELGEVWDAFTPRHANSPNLWTDAYLCAISKAAGVTFVTLDAGIQPPPGVRCDLLRNSGPAQ
ncbi:MAG TPA: TA system VapC family ribonuclease toxin [Bryobacteraceae bacterium]|nr:TA system VapC family ribonuclease toxin [Bryobacteraceae bacterium]